MIAAVNASTAVKWYFEEDHSDAASRLLSPAHTLLAPDLRFPNLRTSPGRMCAVVTRRPHTHAKL